MNFRKNFNIAKIVMYLLVIMLISYGLGALILFATGRGFLKGGNGKTNYTIDETKTSSLDGISEINVKMSSTTINIIPGGTLEVKAHLYGDALASFNYIKPELECYKSGNTLIIKEINKTTLNSSSGSINITMFSGDLNSKSSSGATKIQYVDFNNSIDMHSSSGQIVLHLPKSAEFTLDAAANSGNVTCDFPITVSGKKNDHKLQGTVISDKNKVKLDVSSGAIKILQ